MAILNFGKDQNIVEAIVNAVIGGYRDDLILEELAQAIEDEKISKDKFESAVDALALYKARFTSSIENVVNAMNQFEFNEKQSILKNRPMNLAQQVLQDVEGFNNATNEFYADDDDAEVEKSKPEPAKVSSDEDKVADIKKPQVPVKPIAKQPE